MDKRTLLAIGLSLVVFILWYGVITPKFFPPPPPTPPKKPVATAPAPTPAPAATVDPAATAPKVETPSFKEQEVTLATSELFLKLTSKGAGILEASRYYPAGKGIVPLLQPLEMSHDKPVDERWPHFAVRHDGGPLKIESLAWKIHEHKPNESVEFRFPLPGGVEISKKFAVDPKTHRVAFTLSLENKGPEQKIQLEILAFNGMEHDGKYEVQDNGEVHRKVVPYRHDQYFRGVTFAEKRFLTWDVPGVEKGEPLERAAKAMPPGKPKDEALAEARKHLGPTGGHEEWLGLKNRFFAAILIPRSEALPYVQSFRFGSLSKEALKKAQNLKSLTATLTTEITLGTQPVNLLFEVFLGPLQKDNLSHIRGAEGLIDYGGGCAQGCLPFVAAPVVAVVKLVAPVILGILNVCASIFGNYGVAIIVTTLLIRLVVFPLSLKSQVSMFRMQELAPKMKVLQERYKDDRQKFGQEQIRLFREHKVNPLAGCFPMLLQLPVFIAMFSVFELSIELRRAPFILWITDLCEPDRLLGPWKPVEIPLIITTLSIESFNLLPLLMMLTWFLQAYFAPRSPDPQMAAQQKMMMFLPLVFGLACYTYAGGLSLYFLVNSLLAMAEQKIIKKHFLKPRAGSGSPS